MPLHPAKETGKPLMHALSTSNIQISFSPKVHETMPADRQILHTHTQTHAKQE